MNNSVLLFRHVLLLPWFSYLQKVIKLVLGFLHEFLVYRFEGQLAEGRQLNFL